MSEMMRKQILRTDAEAIRAEIDAQHGCPRRLAAHEIQHVGGGRHVAEVWMTTVVAIEGDADEVTVTIDDADEQHVEPTRRARLREAREPAEIRPPHRDEK